VRRKTPEIVWGGERKGAGRKPLGDNKRIHRSVTIDPDIYQLLASDVEALQAQGLKVKVSDVLNCRLRRDYNQTNHLNPEDLEEAKRNKEQHLKKTARRPTEER